MTNDQELFCRCQTRGCDWNKVVGWIVAALVSFTLWSVGALIVIEIWYRAKP